MRRGRWRWYVFGAQAVVAYGRPRMTADVDVTVEIPDGATKRLLDTLGAFQFTLRFPLAPDFAGHFLPMRHDATKMPVDVTLARPGLHVKFLDRCRRVEIGGAKVPLISAEDLIAIKILAARRKDLEDVRGILLEQHAILKLERVDEVLRDLERATSDARLRARFARVQKQVARLLSSRKLR
jgi:hypothetical protein